MASEAEEAAIYQAYQADENVLLQAIRRWDRETDTLCALAKALPYATLAAAASKALGNSSSSAMRSVMDTWEQPARERWGEAAARDQRRWLRSQDQSLQLLLVAGPPPQEPGRHWFGMKRLPQIHMRVCYMCRQEFVKGHWLGRSAGAGGHPNLCFHCGLANLQQMQAQEAVSLAGSHAVVTGCRHTVGYALTLRLLRCGARVLGTSRFPGAALLNYSREPDFEVWRGRLELMACDFLQPAQVDALVRRIAADPPHIYISNAFLTVEQSSAYYAAMRGIEQRMVQVPQAPPAEKPGRRLPRLLSRLLGRRGGERSAGGTVALPAPGPGPSSALEPAGPPSAVAPPSEGPARAGAALVLSAAAPGIGALAAAAEAWLAGQGLQLNELGNLQEGPRPTLWTDRLREATIADLAKSAWVNQVVPARLLQVAQAAMQRAQQEGGGSAGFGVAGGHEGQGARQRKCFLINVTSTEHLHQTPTHAVTSMSKAAMETLWEKVALERCPGIAAYSADPGFVSGVTDASRKPLTAADGAARVLHPLLAWASGRLPDDQLAHVLVWKDFLPLRVLPAAKALLAGLRMHPLAATLREGPRQPAAAARSGSAGPASVGRLEVVQVAEGQHKVCMVVGSSLRDVGPFQPDVAQMVYDFIAGATTDEVLRAKVARHGGRWAAAHRHIHTQFNKIANCTDALSKRGIAYQCASGLLIGAAITLQLHIARLLLSRQPEAAQEAEAGDCPNWGYNWRLAHFAARYSAADVLRLVQQAAQGLEDCSDDAGRYPIHYATRRRHAAAAGLLAPHALHAALVADRFGHCALSGALCRGRTAAVDTMLAALPLAPAAALLPSQAVQGLTKAGGFKPHQYAVLVRRLLPLVSADCMLLALSRSLAAHPPAAGLLVEAVLHHLPLTEQQWALVPPHTPGLDRAVQPMLTQPAAQAQQLAAWLEQCDVLRLRRELGALCLLRAQHQLDVELPLQLTTRILFLVEEGEQ